MSELRLQRLSSPFEVQHRMLDANDLVHPLPIAPELEALRLRQPLISRGGELHLLALVPESLTNNSR
jgi:hypothetical protein